MSVARTAGPPALVTIMDQVNGPGLNLHKVLVNTIKVARERPLVIQSLFPMLNGQEPPPEEIEMYVERLSELKHHGAQISLVQIYSAHRPSHHPDCGHLPLKVLSRIAHRVREVTGFRAEVF